MVEVIFTVAAVVVSIGLVVVVVAAAVAVVVALSVVVVVAVIILIVVVVKNSVEVGFDCDKLPLSAKPKPGSNRRTPCKSAKNMNLVCAAYSDCSEPIHLPF